MTKKLKNDPTTQVDPNARQKILAVATDLFAEKGLNGTTTREIAKASGLNLSLISYYFGGKEGLYRTIIYEHAKSVKETLENIVHTYSQKELTAEVFEQEIRSIIRHFVEMRIKSESIAKIFMSERTQKMPYCRDVFENLMGTTSQNLRKMISDGQKKGILKTNFPPSVFLMVMIESIFAYFTVSECELSMWKDGYQIPEDKDKLIDFLTQLFTRGIVA